MDNHTYGVLIADPPWQYRNAGGNGAAENHYATMATPDICALPIGHLVTRDAVLYLWATWPMLPDALQVIDAWGFTYKTGLPWIKTQGEPAVDLWGELQWTPAMGTGFWVRGCSELLLIAVRGQVAVPEEADRYLGLLAPRVAHSRKPDHIYQLAERHPGPYLELFARRRQPGWDVFGSEVEGSIALLSHSHP